MTRKALLKFKPETLGKGRSIRFECRNQKTGFQEVHYFYRHDDGDLFQCVTHRHDEGPKLRDAWLKKKQDAS